MKHIKLFEDFINEKLSKSEVAQIEKYLDKLDAEVLFDMCNDFYIEDDEWHDIKNDLDQSELVEWALSYIKSNAIKLNDLKSIYESIITEEKENIIIKNRLTGKTILSIKTSKKVDLAGYDLSDADLVNFDLEGADLEETNMENADLMGANLKGADLEGANLKGANLRDANLMAADLEGADLTDADLRGANLEGADLEGANLTNAKTE